MTKTNLFKLFGRDRVPSNVLNSLIRPEEVVDLHGRILSGGVDYQQVFQQAEAEKDEFGIRKYDRLRFVSTAKNHCKDFKPVADHNWPRRAAGRQPSESTHTIAPTANFQVHRQIECVEIF